MVVRPPVLLVATLALLGPAGAGAGAHADRLPAQTRVMRLAPEAPAGDAAEGPAGDAAEAPVRDAAGAQRLTRTILSRDIPRAAHAELAVLGQVEGAGAFVHVRLGEEKAGHPVHHGQHVLVVGADGTPFALVAGEVADAGDPGPFMLTAAQAVARADAELHGGRAGDPAQAILSSAALPDWTTVEMPGLSPVLARRVVHPRGPRAAWRVEIAERDDPAEMHAFLVDAGDGRILEHGSLTSHAAARARVFPRGPLRPSEMVDLTDGEIVMDVASPAGWLDADETLGNNARVWEDRAGDTTVTPGLTARGVGDPLLFDFPFTGSPAADLDAALTNVFWAFNDAHDRFWWLGFDEASGALQTRNHGRPGRGNDPARVFVQYRALDSVTGIRNTSTAATNADGTSSTFTFGLWNRSGEIRDGALDTGLLYHEYAHVVVVRLLGGDATCDDGNQPAGLAEGWADYFAAAFTGDTVLGAYVSGNAVAGIRTAAIDRSTWTYGNLCQTNPNSTLCIATENGEIWASTLWDLRREMLRVHGPGGGERADRLVVEGLRYTPCQPTYVEARDGILMADLALTGGSDHCLIWGVMATRGLGHGASSTGPDDRYPLTGWALGPECSGAAGLSWDRPRYGDDATARLRLADARAGAASRLVRVTSSAGDSEDLVIGPAAEGPGTVRLATIELAPGPSMPGDGVLSVAEGGSITATCIDCAGAPSAQAAISRSLALAVLTHQLSNESCHDDDSEPLLSGFTAELPSLVDAGELATIAVTLGNAEQFPLEDVRITVTCDNPNVQVLPRDEIRVGAVKGTYRLPAAIPISLRVLAAPFPAVSPGDTATLTFDVSARGLHGTTALVLELAGDYLAERSVRSWGGTETFEASSPSVAGWTHAPAGGRPADHWALQSCGNGGGRAMVYTGPGCGDYADDPAAALLQSPPLFDLSGNVKAIHPLSATWWNDVDLGYAMRSPNYCDSEMVALYLTDNPLRPNFAAPRSDRTTALQSWMQWPGLNIERNTDGWVQAFPQLTISTNSIVGMSLADVRLMWVFFTDVYNPTNDGGCRTTDPEGIGGGYKLDDVTFTYDLARVVPAANLSCTRACGVRTVASISPAGGSRCAGDPLVLSGAGSEAAGCAGTLQYRFTGSGIDSGWIDAPTYETLAVDAGSFTVNVRCSTDTGCSQQITIADPTLDDAHAGRLRPDTLRLRREGSDVVLSWDGTRSPPSYAIFRADAPRDDADARRSGQLDLAEPLPIATPVAGRAGQLSWRDAGAGGNGVTLSTYRVTGALPCAGTALPN